MFLKRKKKIINLFDTIAEMLNVLKNLSNPSLYIADCLEAIGAIHYQLLMEKKVPQKTIENLQVFQSVLNKYNSQINHIDDIAVTNVIDKLNRLKEIFEEEVVTQLNIVFFPYKVTMWDSLESVYKAAEADEDCVTHVVPIPYYQLSQNEVIPTYEGDRFPKDIPVTHYSQYNLEEQEPDIIFVHNIYDNYNTITRVFEQYFTSNLKKYTDMLVYIPYHTPHFMFQEEDRRSLGYSIPSVKNVDRIIFANEMVKKAAIEDGVPKEKLLVLGSPKLDSMVKALKGEISIPEDWNGRIEGKTVYLINTGCLFFANNPFLKLERLIDIFNIPRYVQDSVVIWRPHPLTEISIKKYKPNFLEYYYDLTTRINNNENSSFSNVIFDETDDYIPALTVADVLITTDGSLLRSYLLTEKKVIFWDDNKWKGSKLPNSILDSNVFYYAFDNSKPWYRLAEEFSRGQDELASHRKGMAAKAYVNIDGTAGEKIHSTIKKCVMDLI
ncbi:hypothetical protein ACFPRB_21700 [Metabacillus niabensis]|uniref:CDP-Glycerol:Poly(Glycerophosphate) glycerophosphotransferase n=1 Tax=Metabacillus niabensis TaxID=324854 RepID=A0ABT9Z693_9BACI|nr:hypothetical protein [Metabacillus niabensis]MDQ0227133.1 hypothetical protein [Metabacillus niabensis]